MNDENFRKFTTIAIFILLLTLSYLILKPILMAIIIGLILGFVFMPVYNWFYKVTKSKNLSASLVCLILILLIVLPLWFFIPTLVEQSFKIFQAAQQIDYTSLLKTAFPSLFSSQEFTNQLATTIHSFVTKAISSIMNGLSNIILNLPTIALQLLVLFFTFYFVLRDKDELVDYIKSLLPFSKEVEKKIFDYSRGITSSVLYGQVVIGIFQGLIIGAGFFIFKVPNALFLTLIACFGGIIPMIGTYVIWIPIVIFLLIAGNNFSAFGVSMFGIVSSSIDNILRPIIVSRRVSMHSSIVLIGMIGGLFLFGILGLILGPLILGYLLILLEIYRNKKTPGLFIEGEKQEK